MYFLVSSQSIDLVLKHELIIICSRKTETRDVSSRISLVFLLSQTQRQIAEKCADSIFIVINIRKAGEGRDLFPVLFKFLPVTREKQKHNHLLRVLCRCSL